LNRFAGAKFRRAACTLSEAEERFAKLLLESRIVPTTEPWHRTAFLALLVLTLIVAGYHRLQAHRGGAVSRKGEGFWLFLVIRLSGVAMLLCVLLLFVAPSWVAFARLAISDLARWSGAGLGLVSIAFLGWTLHTLGKNLTDTVATRKVHTLVTKGPYRFVRHPFYVALIMLATSFTLLAANWLLMLCGAITFVLLMIRAPIEERMLEERFGDAYREYRSRTGAVVPRFW
jgi:protein-S-isoprenylcysteine O-methyltransferase Ste14